MFSGPHPLTAQSTYHTILIAPKDLTTRQCCLCSSSLLPIPVLAVFWGPLRCSEATCMPSYIFSALLPYGYINTPLNRWGNWGSERLCGLRGWSGGCSGEWLFWALSVWPQSMLAPLSTAPPCVSGCVKAEAGFDPHLNPLSWPPTPTQMNRQLLALWHWSCIFTYSYFCISNVFISIIQLFSQNRQNLVLMISCLLLGYLGEHQPRNCLGKKP